MPLLANTRALVTGGGSGIGAVIAESLRTEGAVVRVADIDADTRPDHLVDVGDDTAVAAMFDTLQSELGGLDICVNNVGVKGPTGAVEDLDPAAFDDCVRINVGGTFRCTHHAVPLMKAAGGGVIINLSSTAGHHGYPLRSPYAAAKWAIEGLTATWAMELGPFGIRVNAICPGSVEGDRMVAVIAAEAEATGRTSAEVRAQYEDQVSMRRFVGADEVAATAVFLCTDAARSVNGQVISVDGHTESLRAGWPADPPTR
ncbi:MAG: SDR family oxidoreductase [Acidimicrobiales bacterium]